MTRRILALAAFVLATLVVAFTAHAGEVPPAQIDRIFAPWDKPDSPGLALAIVREGKVIYSRGYGQASLEYGVPITATTVFHVASLSKQFTAFCLQLLAQEGKLSLDDPVSKYVPEFKVESATPVTIRHLLHHTSGVRDQWNLALLAGLRMDDVLTESDLLGLILQQKHLNFAPGEEVLYSNAGYQLAGLIVQRVSGQRLSAFAQERIFTPLGMKSTHFQDNYGNVVKNRAYSYARNRDGTWRYVALSYSNTGATSLFTTAEDLALWAAHWEAPRLGGGAAVTKAMTTAGRTNDGRSTGNGTGVAIEPYRGLPVVEHGGSDAGFRAYFLHLPDQKLSVLLLGNAGDLETYELSRRVADLYLEGVPGVQPRRNAPPEVAVQERDVAAFLGDYEVRPGSFLTFLVENGKLLSQAPGGQRTTFHPASGSEFRAKEFEATVSFPPTVGNELAPTALWKANGRDFPLKRIARETPSPEVLQACVGDYWSDELRTLYSLEMRDGKLAVRYPRGVQELKPVHRNLFTASFPFGTFLMKRDAAGACESFAVNTGRVRQLAFRRVRMAP